MRERGKKAYEWLPPSNQMLIDLGCGIGEFTGYYLRKAACVVGFDISPGNLLKAKGTNPLISFVRGECENLPFRSESADATVLTDVLEHVVDPKATIAEIFRVMKSNAYVCLSVPYKGTFAFLDVQNFKYYTLYIKSFLINSSIKHRKTHKHFSLEELRELLNNFELVKYSRNGCLIYPLCIIAYRLTKMLGITFLEGFIRFFADLDYRIDYGGAAFNIMLLLRK